MISMLPSTMHILNSKLAEAPAWPALALRQRGIPRQSAPQVPRALAKAQGTRSRRQTLNAVAAPEKAVTAEAAVLPWQAVMSDVKKRTDLNTILVLGAGPIVIGQVRAACARLLHIAESKGRVWQQACEFDYSGTQACKALK